MSSRGEDASTPNRIFETAGIDIYVAHVRPELQEKRQQEYMEFLEKSHMRKLIQKFESALKTPMEKNRHLEEKVSSVSMVRARKGREM